MSNHLSRRELVQSGAVVLALAACKTTSHDHDDEDVTASEDLMREHGILARVLGVYTAAADRLGGGDRSVIDAVRAAAMIAHDFVEAYHERIEEMYVFPRFERARVMPDLVATLRRQHEVGRDLTARILAQVTGMLDADQLVLALRGYTTMFEAHVAREDTVIFPAWKTLVGKDYDALGDAFEAEEQRHFGASGFETFVAQLPAIEAQVGIADLARFTADVAELRT
jgi:hemerythrin-like domain-containing protein